MPSPARLTDWTSLSETGRQAALAQSHRRLASLGRMLRAVVHDFPLRPSVEGPLGGLPYVVKDMIGTGVAAAGWGCAAPIDDALDVSPVVARLNAAGACLIGTAEMTELAYEPSGINPARGGALNPWNKDAVPGGSSSGSAVLVASGCCFVALGSDTGGSVRIPAHCCGITALKPTFGRFPLDATMPLAPSLDTIGIMARSAADVALVDRVLTGAAPGVGGRIALTMMEDAFAASDPEIAAICRAALDVFRRQGLDVVCRSGFPDEADVHVLTVMQAEASRTHRARIDDPRLDATLRKRLGKGLAIAAEHQQAAADARHPLRDDFIARFLEGGKIAVSPVMPILTPRRSDVDPQFPTFSAKTLYALSRFTRFVNYFGLPAVAFPVGFDRSGLPVALQLIGRPDDDQLLLGLAQQLQAVTDWHARVPTAIASMIANEGVAA